jgi:predicted enzyme related to lactoylglutathione lyase
MNSVSISIDVPDLAKAVTFYSKAFGFAKTFEPAAGVVVLRAERIDICLLERSPGTTPSDHTAETRHYERHWTPVHLDIHVDDLEAAVANVLDAGGTLEQTFENPEHGSVAFCSDPFGHGFCLIEQRQRSS